MSTFSRNTPGIVPALPPSSTVMAGLPRGVMAAIGEPAGCGVSSTMVQSGPIAWASSSPSGSFEVVKIVSPR